MYTSFTEQSWRTFKSHTRSGPIHMLNLIRLREATEYPDGRKATGREAYSEYSRLSHASARDCGMRIIWRGRFEMTAIGPEAERWDICFVAEYPSAEAFIALMRHPDYRAAMAHRQAGTADSRLIRLAPEALGHSFLEE